MFIFVDNPPLSTTLSRMLCFPCNMRDVVPLETRAPAHCSTRTFLPYSPTYHLFFTLTHFARHAARTTAVLSHTASATILRASPRQTPYGALRAACAEGRTRKRASRFNGTRHELGNGRRGHWTNMPAIGVSKAPSRAAHSAAP